MGASGDRDRLVFRREVEDVLVAARVEAEHVAGVRRRGRDGFDGGPLDAARYFRD